MADKMLSIHKSSEMFFHDGEKNDSHFLPPVGRRGEKEKSFSATQSSALLLNVPGRSLPKQNDDLFSLRKFMFASRV